MFPCWKVDRKTLGSLFEGAFQASGLRLRMAMESASRGRAAFQELLSGTVFFGGLWVSLKNLPKTEMAMPQLCSVPFFLWWAPRDPWRDPESRGVKSPCVAVIARDGPARGAISRTWHSIGTCRQLWCECWGQPKPCSCTLRQDDTDSYCSAVCPFDMDKYRVHPVPSLLGGLPAGTRKKIRKEPHAMCPAVVHATAQEPSDGVAWQTWRPWVLRSGSKVRTPGQKVGSCPTSHGAW